MSDKLFDGVPEFMNAKYLPPMVQFNQADGEVHL